MIKFLHAVRIEQTQYFSYLVWEGLINRCCDLPITDFKTAKEAKENSGCIAAHDATTKRKEEAIKHDNFTLIRLDLDDTELDIDSIGLRLQAFNICSYIIHTTAKHQQFDSDSGECYGNRYRVYIELKNSLNYKDWSVIETYLSCEFKADDCAARPQQIMFLPTNFYGIKYAFLIGKGENDISGLLIKASKYRIEEERKYAEITQNISLIPSKVHKLEPLIGKQISLIDTVNNAYEWTYLLRHYGYKEQGLKWLAPESKNGVAGVVLFTGTDGKEKYYSHHSEDPCRTQSHSLDKFDFLCIREYGGDIKNALCGLGEVFLEVTKFNQKEYAINKSNEKAQLLMEAL